VRINAEKHLLVPTSIGLLQMPLVWSQTVPGGHRNSRHLENVDLASQIPHWMYLVGS